MPIVNFKLYESYKKEKNKKNHPQRLSGSTLSLQSKRKFSKTPPPFFSLRTRQNRKKKKVFLISSLKIKSLLFHLYFAIPECPFLPSFPFYFPLWPTPLPASFSTLYNQRGGPAYVHGGHNMPRWSEKWHAWFTACKKVGSWWWLAGRDVCMVQVGKLTRQ